VTRKPQRPAVVCNCAHDVVWRAIRDFLRGELGILKQDSNLPLFSDYSERWLRDHDHHIQPSTKRSYEQLLRLHVTPRFGQMPLKKITRDDVKNLASTISEKGDRSRNIVRWILTALRAVLSSAMEDKLIDNNPASKIGKFNKRERGVNKAQAMTMGEAEAFLNACVEICPDYYPLFFTALRSGLRKSELIALQWETFNLGSQTKTGTVSFWCSVITTWGI